MKKLRILLIVSLMFCLLFSCSDVSHTHEFSSEWTKTSTSHYYASTCAHDLKKDEAPHQFREETLKDATEAEEGEKKYTCNVCGYFYTEKIPVLAHTHTFSSEWTKTSTSHYYASTCAHDLKKDEAPHQFREEILKDATEDEEGEKKYTCNVCGYFYTEKIPVLAHTHTFSSEWTKTSTSHYYASTCAHDLKKDEAPHQFREETLKDATEDEEGEKKYTCNVCGYFYTEKIPVLPATHFYVTYELGFENFKSKDELFEAYVTDFYNFLVSRNLFDFKTININSSSEFFNACKDPNAAGGSEYKGLANEISKFYMDKMTGGTFATQTENSFVGYCYQNGKYLDLLEFLEVFFAYWRTDEGYTTFDNFGNDFFHSPWASFVDTLKYFNFTSENITNTYPWFTISRSPRVHEALDNPPLVSNLQLQTKESINKTITLPTVSRMGYKFLGWFDANNKIVTTCDKTMAVYAKFERITQQVKYIVGGEIVHTDIVNYGLRAPNYEGSAYQGVEFKAWVNDDFVAFDYLNAVKNDISLYPTYESSQEVFGTMTINGYNTQSATTNFAQYEGLFLYKKGVTIGSSLYWHKVLIQKINGVFEIVEVVPSSASRTKEYDYMLLSYSGETTNTYKTLVGLNLEVGMQVSFSEDLSSLTNGSVTVNVTFKKVPTPVYSLILECEESVKYSPIFNPLQEEILPTPTKAGYDFNGWYLSSDLSGEKISSLKGIHQNIKLYGGFIKKEVSSYLDFVSSTAGFDTVDLLPSTHEGATLIWTSSNPNLYEIKDGYGKIINKNLTHQNQSVEISVKATINGVTTTYQKNVNVKPITFKTMDHPKAVYFSIGNTTSYMNYSQRYKTEQTLFSQKFKENMDMVYYAFAIPQENGTLTLNTTHLSKVMELRNYGIRVLLVIDGANRTPLEAMVKLCNNDATRKTFVDNIINLVTQYNFDGVDVDWEFPGILEKNAGFSEYTLEVDRTNLNKLLRDLRTRLNEIQSAGGSNYLLTIATPPTYWGKDRFDYDGRYSGTVGGINDYCDYVNMMSYDLNKPSNASHLAQVHNPANSYSYKFSCDYGVTYYTKLGLDKNKIILGAAAYGKAYNLTGEVNENAALPGLGVTGTLGQVKNYGLAGQSITWNSGTIFYTGIKTLMESGNFVQYDEYNAGKFVGSYLYSSKDKVFITFDSELAIKEKCQYAKNNPGMGIMVWAYGEDATDTIVNTICDNL